MLFRPPPRVFLRPPGFFVRLRFVRQPASRIVRSPSASETPLHSPSVRVAHVLLLLLPRQSPPTHSPQCTGIPTPNPLAVRRQIHVGVSSSHDHSRCGAISTVAGRAPPRAAGVGRAAFATCSADPLLLSFPVDAASLDALLSTCATGNSSAATVEVASLGALLSTCATGNSSTATVEVATLFADACRGDRFRPPVPSSLVSNSSSSAPPRRRSPTAPRSSRLGLSRRPWTAWACGGSPWSALATATSWGTGWRPCTRSPWSVSAGVCIEEGDLAASLFPIAGVGEAAELLVPRRPEDVRRLVKFTFVRPPPVMPSRFLKDYINVMGSDHIHEKAELLHALINDRKLSDLPKISQSTLIIWGEQDQVFPMELAAWRIGWRGILRRILD